MNARPFKLLNAAELAYLRQVITEIAEVWSKHWLLETGFATIQCLEAHAGAKSLVPQPTDEWREYASPRTGSLFIAAPSSTLRRFAMLTFGAGVNHFDPSSTGPSHLLGGVFDKALSDLAARISHAATKDSAVPPTERPAPPPATTWERGSGAVLVKWPLGKDQVDVVLSGAVIGTLLAELKKAHASAPPPRRIRDCIETQAVTLQAWVGEVEIGLGLLQSLSPGDVIRLEASIHEPLQLSLSGAPTPVRAYLGSSGGRKALQMTPPV